MRERSRAGGALVLICCAVCGTGACAEPEPSVGISVVLPLSRIGAITLLQVAALPDPDQVPDCQTLTASCLGESGAAGSVEVTATAPFSEAEAAGAGQLLLLEGLTVGKRYRLVVEAISEGPPVAVEASGCAVTEPIAEGENAEVQVIVNARESVTCDAVL